MTDLWLMLILKSTLILAGGCLIAQPALSRSAAARHLVLLSTLCALLLLPLGWLLPASAVPEVLVIRAATVNAAASPGSMLRAGTDANRLAIVWGAGCAVLLLRLLFGVRRARIMVRGAHIVGTASKCSVRMADNLQTPVAWSFGSGVVVLPHHARNWTEERRQAALAHELAHIGRRDCEALLMGELACALYWFHPLVWYVATRMRMEQEHAADDVVLQQGFGPAAYAEELVSIARGGAAERLLAGAGTASMLTSRVKAILSEERERTMTTRRMVLASAAALLSIALPVAAMQTERKVYKVGGDVIAPKVLHKQEPNYTEEARDAKIEGGVLLSGIIETDGRLTNVSVERRLDPGLDANAVEAVHSWIFRPAEKNGVPVPVSVRIEVNFRLL